MADKTPNATSNIVAPAALTKRIGSTTYKVAIRFSADATETLEDKILRLIESEVRRSA